MQAYLREGERRAFALGNRGPIRFDANGKLAQDILDAYWRNGFYIFEGVLKPDELADIEADVKIHSRPAAGRARGAVDKHGRPALADGCKAPTLFWSKPLGDPFGGTTMANGRHQVKMFEPEAAADAPKEVVYLILGTLQFSEACLRVYGHPGLLAVAASINGDDFVPFNEALFIKEPGRALLSPGTRTASRIGTRRTGTRARTASTSWASSTAARPPMASGWCRARTSSARSTSRNGWRRPASERLPEAVPIVCKPGDVAITNRQSLHGSFANTSKDWRVTVNMGFHRRRSVLGVRPAACTTPRRSTTTPRIAERARMIGYAIDARRQRFPARRRSSTSRMPSLDLRWDDTRPTSRTTTCSTSAFRGDGDNLALRASWCARSEMGIGSRGAAWHPKRRHSSARSRPNSGSSKAMLT